MFLKILENLRVITLLIALLLSACATSSGNSKERFNLFPRDASLVMLRVCGIAVQIIEPAPPDPAFATAPPIRLLCVHLDAAPLPRNLARLNGDYVVGVYDVFAEQDGSVSRVAVLRPLPFGDEFMVAKLRAMRFSPLPEKKRFLMVRETAIVMHDGRLMRRERYIAAPLRAVSSGAIFTSCEDSHALLPGTTAPALSSRPPDK